MSKIWWNTMHLWCSPHMWLDSFHCCCMVCFSSQLKVYSYKYTPDNGGCQSGCSTPRTVHSHWLWKTRFSTCLCLWAWISQSLSMLVCTLRFSDKAHTREQICKVGGGSAIEKTWLVSWWCVLVFCFLFFSFFFFLFFFWMGRSTWGMPKQLCVGWVQT